MDVYKLYNNHNVMLDLFLKWKTFIKAWDAAPEGSQEREQLNKVYDYIWPLLAKATSSPADADISFFLFMARGALAECFQDNGEALKGDMA